ncbi:MAG: UDP-N-acetylmuramate dehydrogenase [Phycisphaerales bacterium]|nr:UDP-N-acetylmuramate dehydrogenase [Phycisphaerales bacterium]
MLPTSGTSLFADLDVQVQLDAPIGQMTWYGVGGTADALVRPRSVEALATLTKRCMRDDVTMRILGNGANLLVADEGVGGIVVKLDAPAFKEIKYNADGDVSAVRVMGGADMAATVMETTRRGLAGLGQMAGIPASIGGALRMNAGGKYGCIGDSVINVACLTRAGDRVTYPASELLFDYRQTNIPDPVIIGATFRMTPDDPIRLREHVKDIFAYKKRTQPLADHSAGCTFRNPIDPVTEKRVSAGRLIDEAGLKGTSIGHAMISMQHANFITVEGGATASDVIALLDLVRHRVFEHCGISLETEIDVWRRSREDEA